MGRLWEDDRQALAGEDAEEPLAGCIGSVVSGIQDAMLEVIPPLAHIADPAEIETASIFADRLSVFIQIAPHHKLADVLNLDIIGIEGINVAEKVFSEGAAVCIAGLATFGPAEIRTFK